MAKKKGKLPKPKDLNAALAETPKPQMRWKAVGLVVAAFVILWVTAFMIEAYSDDWSGWIGVGVVGVATLAALGFGLYLYRLTKRSRGITDILAEAKDEDGRKRALEKLEAGDSKDAMNALARAQLVARDRPNKAIEILEAVEIEKAPAVVQDDLRANLSFLYLMNRRVKDARKLVDHLRLDRQPNAKSKAMYAAVSAEAFARTGEPGQAVKLLETYDANDAEYGDVSAMLLRAQVYTHLASKKKGLARKSMRRLAKVDPNMVAPFLGKGVRPELSKMASEALRSVGMAPKQKMKVQRR